MIKILYLHQYFVPPDGSGGTRSYEMARRLVASGHQVVLITSSAFFPPSYSFPGVFNIIHLDGIELRVLKVSYGNKMSYLRRIVAFLHFCILSSFEAMRVKSVDVVFATSTPLTISIPGVIAKIRHRCNMVFEVRDLWPEIPIAIGALNNPIICKLAEWLEKWSYNKSSHVVALSPGMAEGVIAAGVSRKDISVIPNSSDLEAFAGKDSEGQLFLEKFPHLSGGKLIVYTGTFGKINGVSYLVEIAVSMRSIDPSVRFLLCGNGFEFEKVLALAQNYDVLNSNLWVLESLPKKDMAGLLAAADLACSVVIDVPELWNNSANKFFDALASGTPIMINHIGWQADFINESGCGIVVPPNDPEKAATLLKEFLSDENRLNNAAKAAAYAAREVFNRDVLAEKLRYVLEKAANA